MMTPEQQEALVKARLVIGGDVAQAVLSLLAGLAVRDGRMCLPDGITAIQLSSIIGAVRDLQPVPEAPAEPPTEPKE
jgi:hypothetical protein